MEHGFRIDAEDMVLEDGKFYPVIRAVPGEKLSGGFLTPEQLRYGPCLLQNRHPVLKEYLSRLQKSYEAIKKEREGSESARAAERLKKIQEELQYICAAFVYYEV